MIHPPFTAATWETLPRGTKLVCRDGHYETFLIWVPDVTTRRRLVTLGPNGDVYQRLDSGLCLKGYEAGNDIIGIIQSVTLPEFWVVRWADGVMTVNPYEPVERRSAEHWDIKCPADAPHYVEHHPARVVE